MPSRSLLTRRVAVALSTCYVLLASSACGHVTLISPYDETTDKGVTALEKSISGLLDQLDHDPVPDYASLSGTYDSVFSDLASLRLRNDARPKNTQTVGQLDALRKSLTDLRQLHQQGKLNHVMVGPTRDILEQNVRAILTLELQKKELSP